MQTFLPSVLQNLHARLICLRKWTKTFDATHQQIFDKHYRNPKEFHLWESQRSYFVQFRTTTSHLKRLHHTRACLACAVEQVIFVQKVTTKWMWNHQLSNHSWVKVSTVEVFDHERTDHNEWIAWACDHNVSDIRWRHPRAAQQSCWDVQDQSSARSTWKTITGSEVDFGHFRGLFKWQQVQQLRLH